MLQRSSSRSRGPLSGGAVCIEVLLPARSRAKTRTDTSATPTPRNRSLTMPTRLQQLSLLAALPI
ncbi:MAG: hypothetical protein QOC98_2766, partial [Frankiaceae bacterium]|nr:hypothetical protein [Frankiaceae bacterium]